MYFKNRHEAGLKLAEKLEQYRYDNCVILALSDGAVEVGEQIADNLHCVLTMLLTENIEIPGEQLTFGTVDQDGTFVYNSGFSTGEREEYYGEFHGYLEEQKREKLQRINRLLGDGGILDADMLRDHTVILVADGMGNGMVLEAAAEFLKPIRLEKLVVATPIASVNAVDKMHIIADELHVLGVTDNFFDTNHYYEENSIPSHDDIIAKLNNNILHWR
ncbi:hypothetical protein CYG49_00450 [Candidatus Saccharibacteria bacterium]|nr:MAG: hypothetical protein CYG49_00450 [Candidatus Saccharibacteria bacterium]